ncbi:exonuclease domain-containing protein [Yinghuangia seranimata]|uniref:exonuclease domain-containing protein n=1 Tax=Yinghuangia seranimata TaxID=408067 RepID=UPI00248BB89C|nr:exonuclease domain-containing protein [Yinghuangia seranimata]MDI2126365.1 exonuclease domain-containing protein [Yinghuangia seranimata]
MATNRYGAACATCSTYVQPGEGALTRVDGKWTTYCRDCEPKPAAPARGTHEGWHQRPLAAFDLETSGVDVTADFIVSAAVCDSSGATRTWLVDPGDRDIPAEATAVHGITTAHARAHGSPAAECLAEIADILAGHLTSGTPVAVYNAVFDLTLLDAELRRHGLTPLAERTPVLGPIVDPLIIDKQLDRFRRGKRTLEATSAFYGVAVDGAHTADGDALACLRLAQEIGARYPKVAVLDPHALHNEQRAWAAEQAASFQAYLDRTKPGHGERIAGDWPIGPIAPPAPARVPVPAPAAAPAPEEYDVLREPDEPEEPEPNARYDEPEDYAGYYPSDAPGPGGPR